MIIFLIKLSVMVTTLLTQPKTMQTNPKYSISASTGTFIYELSVKKAYPIIGAQIIVKEGAKDDKGD